MPCKTMKDVQIVDVSFAKNEIDMPSVRIGGGLLKEITGIPQGSVQAFTHDKDKCELSTRERRVFIVVDTRPELPVDEMYSDYTVNPKERYHVYTQHNLDGEKKRLQELRVFAAEKNRYGTVVLKAGYPDRSGVIDFYLPTDNMKKEGPEGIRPPFRIPWVVDAGNQAEYCWFGSPTLVYEGRQEGLKELKIANTTLLKPSKEA